MRFEVGQKRTALAARYLSIALVTITVGLVAITAAFFSQGTSSLPNSTTSTTASTSQGTETVATSQTSTSSTVSRIADTQSTYSANVSLSSSLTTSTEMNATMTNCTPPGGATMELQVVSDTTGMPVQQGAPAVSAAFETGCNAAEFHTTETLYFDRVSEGSSGWFDIPNNSTDNIAGGYNFTVGYAGNTYLFSGGTYPDSTTCVTLAVPSGVVTLASYQFSNYDCAGNLVAWAGKSTYACFGEVYLRVLSDSDSAPVAGAVATTSYDFPYTCVPCSVYPSCFSGEAFVSFTTTSTEWYAFGDATNSFSVEYGGQTYNVTASQRAGSTCVTLQVPSGAVDTTYGTSCTTAGSSASTTLQSSTTSTSTTVNFPACGAPLNTVLNPAPKGTVYMKVATDQGTVITNGTLFVTQFGNATNGEWGLTNHYCIRLGDVNGTGYLQLAGNMTFIASGYYNVTFMAGYNQGPGYSATIPSIQVHPNSTIYVTVSVPSGVVTVVTSNEGSSTVTTTTTSATSIKNGG